MTSGFDTSRSSFHIEVPLRILIPVAVVSLGLIGVFLWMLGAAWLLPSQGPVPAAGLSPEMTAGDGWLGRSLRSVVLSVWAALVSVGIALPLALQARKSVRLRNRVACAAAMMAAVPWVVSATGWTQMLYVAGGWNRPVLEFWTLTGHGAEWQRLMVAGLLQGFMGAPLAALCLVFVAPPLSSDEEAAQLSAGPWMVFWRIVRPRMVLPVAAAGMALSVWHFNEMTVADLMRVRTWTARIFAETAGLGVEAALQETGAVVLWNGAWVAGLLWLVDQWRRRTSVNRPDWSAMRLSGPPPRGWQGKVAWFIWLIPSLAGAVLLLAGVLAWSSGGMTWSAAGGAVQTNLVPLFEGMWIALVSGILTAVFSMGLGLLCITSVPRATGWGVGLRVLGWGLVALLLSLSSLGVSLVVKQLASAVSPLLGRTQAWVILAASLRAAPWGAMVVVAWLHMLPNEWDAPAKALGADPWQVFRRVLIPHVVPLAGLLVLLGFVMGSLDLASSVLLAPPGRQPLISNLFNALHYSHDFEMVIMALMMALPFPMLLAAGLFLWKK